MKEKILEYFNKNGTKYLDILDEDVRNYPVDKKNYYTGVTLDYIVKYVLENEYPIDDVAECLKQLHLDDEIHSLFCNHIEEIVFESKVSSHWNYREDGFVQYKTHISHLHKYLDDIIEKNRILVAVYGSLRKGFGNHRLLKNARYLGTFNSEPVYNLHDLGGFPGLKHNGNTSVVMEVYKVTPEEAYNVDCLEGYNPNEKPTFYDKEIIETPFGKAGVYIYVNNLDDCLLVEPGDYYLHRFGKVSEEHLNLVEV